MDDDIERFEEERELELYREYRDVLPMFTYVIETERRFYLANQVDVRPHADGWLERPGDLICQRIGGPGLFEGFAARHAGPPTILPSRGLITR